MPESHALHPAAAGGFQAGATTYVRGRPDYPPAIEGWLHDTLRLGPGRRVVDLGAGTGKFTAHLLAIGADVVAVEPVQAMREQLRAALPGVETLAGQAEAMSLPDESLDAVLCATAFHWFASDATMREIRRVLKPGGRLGLVWNRRDESVGWVERLGLLVSRREGDAPRAAKGEWRKVFPAKGFGPLHEASFGHAHDGGPEDVIVARVLSTSFIAALSDAERETVAREVRACIASEPELAGKTTVSVPYVTQAYWAERF